MSSDEEDAVYRPYEDADSFYRQRVTTTEACEIFNDKSEGFDTAANNNNVFGDISTSNIDDVANQQTSITPTKACLEAPEESKEIEKRPSPEEEFFQLSCRALRIKLTEQRRKEKDLTPTSNTPATSKEEFVEVLNTISESKLFRLCQKKKIPFYQWHDWIKDQFDRVIQLQVIAVKKHSPRKSELQAERGISPVKVSAWTELQPVD